MTIGELLRSMGAPPHVLECKLSFVAHRPAIAELRYHPVDENGNLVRHDVGQAVAECLGEYALVPRELYRTLPESFRAACDRWHVRNQGVAKG